MKKSLILTLVIISCGFGLQAFSENVTNRMMTNPDYMKNQGFSEETIRLVQQKKAQDNGKDFIYNRNEPEYYKNKYIKFFRWVYRCADPAVDDQKFMQHKLQYNVRLDDI